MTTSKRIDGRSHRVRRGIGHGIAEAGVALHPQERSSAAVPGRVRWAPRSVRWCSPRRAKPQQQSCSRSNWLRLHDPIDETVDAAGVPGVAEVDHRGLGQRTRTLVRARDDEVGAEADCVDRQIRVHAEVGAPGLIDDQRDIVGVGRLGDGGDIGHGAEVARRNEVDGGAVGMLRGVRIRPGRR